MKIAHAELNRTIEIEPISPCEWVIESPKLFAKYIQELLKQSSGEEGDFIFSKDEKIIDFSKKGEIILNPFLVDINEKRIVNKLYVQLNELAHTEAFYMQTQEILHQIHQYIYELEQESRHILCMNDVIDLSSIFKAVGVQHEVYEEDFCDNLCRYIKVIGEVLGIRLVAFVNLRSFLSDEQLYELIKNVSYEDISLLLIESKERSCISGVNRYIIDMDLCEI